jgi:class 3 adenylate cyclase
MPTSNKRHAAIIFTDIAGYSSMMVSDEDKAFEVLAINRKIHSNFIAQYNGN